MSGTVAAEGREFQILGDATEKLRVPNALHANEMLSRLVLEDLSFMVHVSSNLNVNMTKTSSSKK